MNTNFAGTAKFMLGALETYRRSPEADAKWREQIKQGDYPGFAVGSGLGVGSFWMAPTGDWPGWAGVDCDALKKSEYDQKMDELVNMFSVPDER